ncbi:hypothetical protein [Acidovorax sp.]|uniref:hypothetical protein n=1 Tax=Acidovorax sp. TaxID=1872122 RepID=UPI00391FA94A
MSTPINPIYWERTGKEPVQVIDVRTLPEDVKTAIILAATSVAKEFDAGVLAALGLGRHELASLTELSEVVANMHSFMHELPGLVPAR